MSKEKETTKLRLKPIAGTRNKVFVEPVKKSEKLSPGGIYIPVVDTSEENVFPYEFYGNVLAVSEIDETGVKPNVKVGETVYFGPNFSTEEFDGITYFLMKESNIFGKL